uniref:Uncharacterized protein n=1 Tax=Anguilla anguilla TaxID=7936 RepID=A0A0E9WM22_ANGAN
MHCVNTCTLADTNLFCRGLFFLLLLLSELYITFLNIYTYR